MAGTAARGSLASLAKEPGQEALAAALLDATALAPYDADADPAKLLADLIAIMPLQPASATADRDRLLAGIDAYDLASWLTACRTSMPNGKPGCVMVVADFNQIYDGNEAVLVLRDAGDSMRYEALATMKGIVERRSVSALEGYLPFDANGATIITQMQAGPPNITPAPLNQLIVGDRSLLILP